MKFPLWGASQWAPCLTLLSVVVVVLESSFVEPPEPVFSLRSLAEDETRLPCHYQVEANNTVVQVTWHKELADGTKEQIITAHFSEGHTEFGRYSGRVRFESASPTEYSALLIPNTEESDEGSYTCQITTFPLGNFERRIMLTVWNPPDAAISSSLKEWVVGAQSAELTCSSGGNPEPGKVTWTWKGGALPDGVTVIGGKLVFGRAIRMNDSGTYECVAKNNVGAATTEITLAIAEQSRQSEEESKHNLLLIIIGAAAGGLVMIMVLVILLVNRHHRRKNKKLEMELSERTEEMNTLSRHTSNRRLNSVSTDPRAQPDDYALLRVDSRIKSSQLSLQERPIYKGSQSTLADKWGTTTGVEVDELGRPVLWPDSREGIRRTEADGEREERRRRVESYLKSSNMSLDSGLPSSLVPLKPQPDDSLGPKEQDPGSPTSEGGTPMEPDWGPNQSLPEEGDEGDSSSSSLQISEALTNHFYYSNGVLRPKPHSNAILLHPRGQVI